MTLEGTTVPINSLALGDIDAMYSLMARFYERSDRARFERDLSEKDDVILLRNEGTIQGFSTLKMLETKVDNRIVRAVFSGDTIIDREHWGSTELPRQWGRYTWERSGEDTYWFLLSKGFRTYRFLPVFFQEFYPRVDTPMPPERRRVLDAFAMLKYPNEYDAENGVIRVQQDYLSDCVADVPDRCASNQHIKFFLEKNPGWIKGEELACLVPLQHDNYNRRAKEIIGVKDPSAPRHGENAMLLNGQ